MYIAPFEISAMMLSLDTKLRLDENVSEAQSEEETAKRKRG
jgi:hypothetical protein